MQLQHQGLAIMNRQSKRLIAMLCHGSVLLFACWCGAIQAQVPHVLNYQGYLTNPGGTPVNAPVVMTFRLYNGSSGGVALYTETQLSVPVINGLFNAVIGSATPLNLPFDVPYWLSVAVNSDAEMSPRQQVTSSAYALRSANADALAPTAPVAGSQVTGSISIGTLPAANLTGTIGTAQIADNTVTQAKLSPVSGAAPGKVLGTDGTNLQWQTDTSSGGTVTSVGVGAGLTGGPITTTGTINLAATQLLPAIACATDQVVKWSGSAWACAADSTALVFGTQSSFTTFLQLSCTNYAGASLSFTPSVSGKVIVSADAWIGFGHTAGVNNIAYLYIGKTATECVTGTDFTIASIAEVTQGLPTAGYNFTVPVRRVYSVTGGTPYTFYLNGLAGNINTTYFNFANMILQFTPN
jgi:hypothetical protein